ncbi:MAG: transcription termination/antitermination protein NusG [Planctomycetia bacterium]
MAKRWYVLKVQSGREASVQEKLVRQLKLGSLDGAVSRVLVPLEVVTELKGGQKRTRKNKIYPGYVFLEVEQVDGEVPAAVRALARSVPGAGNFVGAQGHPEPLSQPEVDRLLAAIEKSESRSPQLQISLKKGDKVKIKEGALESFEGVVEDIMPAKGLVRVTVTIFGRATPVELEYWQVELVS